MVIILDQTCNFLFSDFFLKYTHSGVYVTRHLTIIVLHHWPFLRRRCHRGGNQKATARLLCFVVMAICKGVVQFRYQRIYSVPVQMPWSAYGEKTALIVYKALEVVLFIYHNTAQCLYAITQNFLCWDLYFSHGTRVFFDNETFFLIDPVYARCIANPPS